MFYKRPNLEIKKINSWDEIIVGPGKKVLVVVKNSKDINDLKIPKKSVYQSFPDWIKKFNINHWVERTNFWKVYELNYGNIQ